MIATRIHWCTAPRAAALLALLALLASAGCGQHPSPEQAKRDAANRQALDEFERQQADATLSNWDEARLLAALSSNDVSDRANAARELGLRKSRAARGRLLELMLNDRNETLVSTCQQALIAIGDPDDIAAIRDYALPRAATLDSTFLQNLVRLDDAWVETLLQDAWQQATDNKRREVVVHAQTARRNRMTR